MRRALLIGSQTHGLVGVHDDLERVGRALEAFGFIQRHLRESDATREGILAGFRGLIAECEVDDVVMVYYSGHGGAVTNPEHRFARGVQPRTFQYLVPTDHSRERFRGILSSELSALLAELTARTRNVTCVLDCCHAANMIRGERVYRAKALTERPWDKGCQAHAEWLRSRGYDLTLRGIATESNPNAVRLFACKTSQSAYEYTDDAGRSGGVLTEAFLSTLSECSAGGEPFPSWRAMGDSIVGRVQRVLRVQHPIVHGPHQRRLFALESGDSAGLDAFSYQEKDDDALILRAGRLHGVHVGERFLLMPLNSCRPDRDIALAEAEAVTVGGHETHLKVARLRPSVLPPGGRAFRFDPRFTRRAVCVAIGDEDLRTAIAQAPRLCIADTETRELLATVRRAEPAGGLVIEDGSGRRLREFCDQEPNSVRKLVVEFLDQLARVEDLLALRSGTGTARLRAVPRVEWGKVVDGRSHALPLTGAELKVEERVYVKVTNGQGATHYAWVFCVDVSRAIRLLSSSGPDGVELRPGQHYILGGAEFTSKLVGVPLEWAEGVPRGAQPIALVVITSDQSADLRALERDVLGVSELLEAKKTTVRDFGEVRPAQPRAFRYAITQIRFSLRPFFLGGAHEEDGSCRVHR